MVVEQHIHTGASDDSSSSMAMIVAIVAILLIVGLGIFALRSAGYFPAGGSSQMDIDVDTGGNGEAPTGDVNL